MLPARLNGLGGAWAERTARRIREPLWEVSSGTCNFPVSPSSFNAPFLWRISGDKCIRSAGPGGFLLLVSAGFGARHGNLRWKRANRKIIAQHDGCL